MEAFEAFPKRVLTKFFRKIRIQCVESELAISDRSSNCGSHTKVYKQSWLGRKAPAVFRLRFIMPFRPSSNSTCTWNFPSPKHPSPSTDRRGQGVCVCTCKRTRAQMRTSIYVFESTNPPPHPHPLTYGVGMNSEKYLRVCRRSPGMRPFWSWSYSTRGMYTCMYTSSIQTNKMHESVK